MGWTDEYREIVEFYYWEPQHIGRAGAGPRFAGADEMYAHVNTLEVSLNHILNLFFSLYPIEKLACFAIGEPMEMLSAAVLERYQRQQKNATQPDMFFAGKTGNVALELKLAAKSDLAQIIKYITFNAGVAGTDKPLTLIYLSPTDDPVKIFREKYASPQAILSALADAGCRNLPDLRFITYKALYHSLEHAVPENATEQKLLSGLMEYISARGSLI